MTNQQMHDNLVKALKESGVEEGVVAEVVKNFFVKINTALLDALLSAFGPEADKRLKEGMVAAKTHEESSKLIEDLCREYKVDLEAIVAKVTASATDAAWRSIQSKLTMEQWQKFINVLQWEE